MRITSAEFVRAAKEPSHYPPPLLPEVAFAGRSNVGKSTLINTLLERKGLARTSNTPGRTREINFFVVNGCFTFVDLPGYGYAKAPLEVRRSWGPMVETYLRERRNLRLVVLLFDIRRDPSDQDRQLIEWLLCYRRPFAAVLTKCDKLSGNERRNRYRFLTGGALAHIPAPVMFSSTTKEGREPLWRMIAEAVSLKEETNLANGS